MDFFYTALHGGDISLALNLLDSSIEWTEAVKSPYYSGTWIRRDAVHKNLFESLGRDWISFAMTLDSFVVEGTIVVALGIYTGTYKATGESFDAQFAHRWQVSDCQLTAFHQFTDTVLTNEILG